jgi:hypothetical protein
VCLVHDGVHSVGQEERDGDDVEVLERYLVVLLSLLLGLGQDVLIFEDDSVRDGRVRRWADANVHDSRYLPEFYDDTHPLREENHPA